MKRILEVGPAINPMHHRYGDRLEDVDIDERELQLKPDEDYTVLDQPIVDFNHRIWQAAKETYGERVHFVHGDRADVPFEDESFDELVSLGSHANEGKIISEFRRVLKPGGILRLGVGAQNAQDLMNTWGTRLKRLGFTFVEEQIQKYKYVQRKGRQGTDYVVLVFRKGN